MPPPRNPLTFRRRTLDLFPATSPRTLKLETPRAPHSEPSTMAGLRAEARTRCWRGGRGCGSLCASAPIYIYMYIYIHAYAYIYECMYVCMYVFVNVYVYITYVGMYYIYMYILGRRTPSTTAYIYINLFERVCVCVCVRARVRTCVCACVWVCMYTVARGWRDVSQCSTGPSTQAQRENSGRE